MIASADATSAGLAGTVADAVALGVGCAGRFVTGASNRTEKERATRLICDPVAAEIGVRDAGVSELTIRPIAATWIRCIVLYHPLTAMTGG
jgi:hypothetical protein